MLITETSGRLRFSQHFLLVEKFSATSKMG
jgi:hypothetical protein